MSYKYLVKKPGKMFTRVVLGLIREYKKTLKSNVNRKVNIIKRFDLEGGAS